MITTLLLCGFIYILYSWLTSKPKNFPPGLPILPLVGSVPFIPRKLTHLKMHNEWYPKYGPLMGFIVGNLKAVAVLKGKTVIEVLQREEFQGRIDVQFFRDRSFGKLLGVFFSEGKTWMEQRRFSLRHLRDFGFGKKTMEMFIMEEVEDIIKEINNKNIFETTGFFAISSLNVLWGMIAGTRYARDDENLQVLIKKIMRSMRAGNPVGGPATAFPLLNKLVPKLTGYSDLVAVIEDLQNFLRESIREHESSIDYNNPRDLMDVYIREIKLQKENTDTSFTEEGLITLCLDLFIAGGETTAASLGFALLYMLLHPEVQKKVQNELDKEVGRNRRPSLEDRSRLNYTEAVLTELMRVCSIAPVAPPHKATRDTTLNGYYIPKDTFMIVNIYSVFQDKEHWGDPEVFRPERFLNSEGKFVKDDWMIPFGLGKRVCIGEVLARSNIFLIFTSLLQEFSFSIPEGDSKPSTVPIAGFTISPQPFRVKATLRE